VKFSKMANFNFRESWFGFFLFSEIRVIVTQALVSGKKNIPRYYIHVYQSESKPMIWPL
jgi:hypothetical protein